MGTEGMVVLDLHSPAGSVHDAREHRTQLHPRCMKFREVQSENEASVFTPRGHAAVQIRTCLEHGRRHWHSEKRK